MNADVLFLSSCQMESSFVFFFAFFSPFRGCFLSLMRMGLFMALPLNCILFGYY